MITVLSKNLKDITIHKISERHPQDMTNQAQALCADGLNEAEACNDVQMQAAFLLLVSI